MKTPIGKNHNNNGATSSYN